MLLPLQGVNAMAIRNPGCRFACPGLGAFGLSARALLVAKPYKNIPPILNTLPNGVRLAQEILIKSYSNNRTRFFTGDPLYASKLFS